MEKIIKNIIKSIPFPYFNEKGKGQDGTIIKLPKPCHDCNSECLKNKIHRKIECCAKGYNYLSVDFPLFILTIIGLSIKGHIYNISRKDKKARTELAISEVQVIQWCNRTEDLLKEIDSYKNRMIDDHFSLFHDIIPTISSIFRNLEKIINKNQGKTYDEKLENSDDDLKTLYHSVDLLDNRLKLMPLITNPESAKYGQLYRCHIYKTFDKVRRIFRVEANAKNVNIRFKAEARIDYEPQLYESFITIPFILIENAVKYSINNSDISILFSEDETALFISVISIGPVVTNPDKEKIFEKGFKDDNAKQFSSKGSGIGLYFAKVVADANNVEIMYRSSDHYEENGMVIGKNSFSILLPKN